ncbi:MAG: DNA polymerase domain-containing protein [Candidatus Nitrosocosmicus sp.]
MITTTTTTTTASALTNEIGYLFDIYHIKDKVILWIKENNGNVRMLEYLWPAYFYVVSDEKFELTRLLNNKQILSLLKEYEFVNRFEHPSDHKKRQALKLVLDDSSQLNTLATRIENICARFGHYRLYNIDILPEQSFLYEKELYPLGLCNEKVTLERQTNDLSSRLSIDNENNNKDNKNTIDSFDYVIPNFKFLSFDIVSDKKSVTTTGKIANSIDNKIQAIVVNVFNKENKNSNTNEENLLVSKNDESETLLEFSYHVKKLDPDIILTKGGDQLLFPYLLNRAKVNEIELQLLTNLNRETNPDFIMAKYRSILKTDVAADNSNASSSSSSFISYGKVYFKPRPFFLYGRIHIDTNYSFIYKENGLDGLAEISRVCRIPMQLASRSTIGKCLSSLYFYNEYKKGILVSWKPKASETFKTFNDLMMADKGGFVFESKPGLYEEVAEFDFVSLYPSIMLKENISSETINCECCKYEKDNKVPGLEHLYHTCKRKIGIVPLSLKTVLERRLEYKRRKNNCNNNNNHHHHHHGNNFCLDSSNPNDKLKDSYDNRQSALKWILVTSFGYLGFSNSKFGRIDAHIAVCAFARDILLKTSKVLETFGFEIIHGIVDSIWIKKRNTAENNNSIKCDGDTIIIYENLKKEIEDKTGFSISFEGTYRWIVFDSSKKEKYDDADLMVLPALNRYFGVFKYGALKTRGIELRRHDTPSLFVKFQLELLKKISSVEGIDEIKIIMPDLENIYKKYMDLIYYRKIHFSELVFTKRISKDSDGYINNRRNTIESCVINTLFDYGKSLSAGEEIKYIITDFYNKNPIKRAIPIELSQVLDPIYDTTRYCKLLYDSYVSIIKYFK